MDIFLKITAAVLITTILSLILQKQNAGIALLLIICVCSIAMILTFKYIRPVFDFVNTLMHISNMNVDYLDILIKVVGIGLLSQIVTHICSDADCHALGKCFHMITTLLIICFCVPLMEDVLTLVKSILDAT